MVGVGRNGRWEELTFTPAEAILNGLGEVGFAASVTRPIDRSRELLDGSESEFWIVYWRGGLLKEGVPGLKSRLVFRRWSFSHNFESHTN